jgi:GNAT superfamily N-acetyltransferase
MAELVLPSWLQSYSRSLVAKWCRADSRFAVGREVYWSNQRKRIESILATPTTHVIVASISGINVGWACEDRRNNTLHYIYVKDNFRRQGIAKRLAGWINETKDVVRLTHLPPPWFAGPAAKKGIWQPHVVIDLIGC